MSALNRRGRRTPGASCDEPHGSEAAVRSTIAALQASLREIEAAVPIFEAGTAQHYMIDGRRLTVNEYTLRRLRRDRHNILALIASLEEQIAPQRTCSG